MSSGSTLNFADRDATDGQRKKLKRNVREPGRKCNLSKLAGFRCEFERSAAFPSYVCLLKENETGGMDTATRSKLSGIKMNELREYVKAIIPGRMVLSLTISRDGSVFGSVSSISWRNELFGWLKDSYFSSCCSFFFSLFLWRV